MPRRDTEEYRAYLRAKRQELTGINKSTNRFEASTMVSLG